MKTPTARSTLLVLALLVLARPSLALTAKECALEARTELENIYCEVLAKGKAASLPGFFSFRANSAQIQILLLKAPARSLGIALPAHQTATREDNRPPPAPGEPATQPSPSQAGANEEHPAPSVASGRSALANCTLDSALIRCPGGEYHLIGNLSRHELPPNALERGNRLIFPVPQPQATALQYLSAIYPLYIEKMLTLGLGDATLSFTKFHALYQRSAEDEQDFAGRFEQMYEVLKEERRTLRAKAGDVESFPPGIANCMGLSERIIVCDNVERNWIYQRN